LGVTKKVVKTPSKYVFLMEDGLYLYEQPECSALMGEQGSALTELSVGGFP